MDILKLTWEMEGGVEGEDDDPNNPLSRALRAPDNRADEEYSLFARRKAPHNQRMEQMPSGHSSSARLCSNQERIGNQ